MNYLIAIAAVIVIAVIYIIVKSKRNSAKPVPPQGGSGAYEPTPEKTPDRNEKYQE